MSGELTVLLTNIGSYVGLIPCILALFRIKSSIPEHRLLAILVWGGTGIGFLGYLMAVFNLPNLFLLHLYTVFNFIMMTLIFRSVIPRKITYLLLFAYGTFASYNSIWVEQLQTFNVLNRSISAFIIMFYPLLFFVKTMQELKVQRLEVLPLFWLSIGALFYNAASFFIFLFSRDIALFEELWHTYFGIHAIFTILLYIFYTIALWVRPKT